MMNAINNNDNSTAASQGKYRQSYDMSNPFYQNMFYRLPGSGPTDLASLRNAYGANPLLATQFSFQYSDNQGLGDGGWTGAGGGGLRNGHQAHHQHQQQTQQQAIEATAGAAAQFFSLPSQAPTQSAAAASQSVFYQYGYGAPTGSMYWPHPGQNYPPMPPSTVDKSSSWSDAALIGGSGQYPPISNYKQPTQPSQANQLMGAATAFDIPPNGYHHHQHHHHQMSSNGSSMPVLRRVSADAMPSATIDPHMGKSEHHHHHDKKLVASAADLDALQSQMTECVLQQQPQTDNGGPFQSRQSATTAAVNPTPEQLYSAGGGGQSYQQKGGADLWNTSTTSINKIAVGSGGPQKSYAKAAKLQSRSGGAQSSVTNNNTSYIQPYFQTVGNGGVRPSFKQQQQTQSSVATNGFSTGFSKPQGGSGANNNNNCWFGSGSNQSGMSAWGGTGNKSSKWSQNNSSSNNKSVITSESAGVPKSSSWAAKATPSSEDEIIRQAELTMKQIQSQINPKTPSINFEKTRYFVIKSYSEDDIHRSIKYKIWCSTKEGNDKLHNAFKKAQETGGHVILFFSVNGSGHFCGVAEMTSEVDKNTITGVWCQDKWKGKFDVKWIYVKDVPNTQLRHISTKVPKQDAESPVLETKPITNLRDATEVTSDRLNGTGVGGSYKEDPGYQALKVIMDCKSSMSIFDDFVHYERREYGIES